MKNITINDNWTLACRTGCGKTHTYTTLEGYERAKINGHLCPSCTGKAGNYEGAVLKMKQWRENGGLETLRKNGILSTGLSLDEYAQYIRDKETAKELDRQSKRAERQKISESKRMVRLQVKQQYINEQRAKQFTDPNEQWKVIARLPRYEASTNGRVRNKKTLRVLKALAFDNGYTHYNLYDDNRKPYCLLAHRLIAQTWIDNPHNKPQVNHINHVRDDNR